MENKENALTEDFGALLDEYLGKKTLQHSVVKGTVVGFDDDMVIVDVGLKSEGRIPVNECGEGLSIGDSIDVYIDRYENKDGNIVLSREKAKREEVWGDLEQLMNRGEQVVGTIYGRVRGGFTVNLKGATAFLPGSQIDVRPIRDPSPLFNVAQPFVILKMDKLRGNIVVSRRAVLEESRAEQRSEVIKTLSEGQIIEGTIKNITDYGAFVDLGGIDGLLHVTDISWKRLANPTDILTVGQPVTVKIIKFNADTGRISLGMKQLEEDPWIGIETKFPVGTVLKGNVSNITDYGVFVDLGNGVEGLVHVSEMSWTKKNVHPGKIVSLSQEVEVIVLEVDEEKRRISLGMKQIQENPWSAYAKTHAVGDIIEGEIKNIIEFGIFVALTDELDGMIHTSDLSWDKSDEEVLAEYKKGMVVKAKILDIDVEKERISLGIKQLQEDPYENAASSLKKGDVTTVTITAITDDGIEVEVEGIKGFIKRADLAQDRAEQRPERFAVGEKVDAKVTLFNEKTRKLNLSIKAKEQDERKKALEEFGSADSGASLGDILGAALAMADKKAEEPKKTARKKKTEVVEEDDFALEATTDVPEKKKTTRKKETSAE